MFARRPLEADVILLYTRYGERLIPHVDLIASEFREIENVVPVFLLAEERRHRFDNIIGAGEVERAVDRLLPRFPGLAYGTLAVYPPDRTKPLQAVNRLFSVFGDAARRQELRFCACMTPDNLDTVYCARDREAGDIMIASFDTESG